MVGAALRVERHDVDAARAEHGQVPRGNGTCQGACMLGHLAPGRKPEGFRPWSAGPPRTHTSLRVSILPPECRLCGTTNWTAFVCKRLSRRPLDMIRAGPALGKHGHTSKCTTQSPDRPLEAAVEALVIAYCFFTGDGSYPSPFHAGGTPDARKQKKTVTYSFRVLTVALASDFFKTLPTNGRGRGTVSRNAHLMRLIGPRKESARGPILPGGGYE